MEDSNTQRPPNRGRDAAMLIAGAVVLLIVEVLCLIILIYSGAYNISTSNHDNRVINRALDTGMTRAAKHHAQGIQSPSNLSDQAVIQTGFEHYQDMCVQCHGAPGVAPDEIAKGLWPKAPNLAKTVPTWTPGDLFWITKNGIKFSAMPAWGPTHDDPSIWAMVAFLEQLPKLSPEAYKQMKTKPKRATHETSATEPKPHVGNASTSATESGDSH